MATAQQLPDWARTILQEIDETKHGAVGAFCDKAKIQNSQFRKLIETGKSSGHVIIRVLEAIGQKPKTEIDLVCEEYRIAPEDLMKKANAEARHVAAYLMSKRPEVNFTKIAKELGYKDHSGVHNALSTIGDRMDTERALRKRIFSMQAKL